jgi:very-short-patch-repair endonuclease
MRDALRRRGFVGAPHPSVLESKLLRLLRQHRIHPVAVEVMVGPAGRYRVDVVISEGLLVEVDGYAHHHTPEQKAEDERRRNRIRLTGKFLLVYTWRDVVYDGGRVAAEIREALSQSQSLRNRAEWRANGGARQLGARQLTGAARRPPVL